MGTSTWTCDVLPTSSLVGFDVSFDPSAETVWSNRMLDDPKRWAWRVSDTPAMGPRTAFAERYGGRGTASNGGGARCGILDGVQIKGIGRNPLAGRQESYWHSYGGARMDECVAEVLWTEIVNEVLPYSAPACYAILRLSQKGRLPRPTTTGRTDAWMGLLLREPTLRLGHFVSASRFNWKVAQVPAGLGSESERTRAAVHALPRILARAAGCEDDDFSKDRFKGHLELVLSRIAEQLAQAHAKKIVHGGLSLSNTGVNGGWIDFGATYCVGDYGPLITSGARSNAWPPVSGQHIYFSGLLRELQFALDKFLPGTGEDLGATFLAHYFRHENFATAGLSGLSPAQLLRAPGILIENFAKAARRILETGMEPRKLVQHHPPTVHPTPQQMGLMRLNACVTVCALLTHPKPPVRNVHQLPVSPSEPVA